MELINRTPFSTFVFESIDVDGDHSSIVVLRGTFGIVDRSRLVPLPSQRPCVTADQYSGEPLSTPLVSESDLVPTKHKIDVFLKGHAIAPNGIPATQWECSVDTGSIRRCSVTVNGPRNWQYRTFHGWQLGASEPVERVRLCYANAFGGAVVDVDGTVTEFANNPIGCGFTTQSFRRNNRCAIRAPIIESPHDRIGAIEKTYQPICFAPIPKAWPQRLKWAGTYDEAWLTERWPQWPRDFDPLYFNAAHPDLQLDDLEPGEVFCISGVNPCGPIRFSLPEYSISAQVEDEFGATEAVLHLDTIDINADAQEVGLVWRGNDLRLSPVQRIEINMSGKGVRFNAR